MKRWLIVLGLVASLTACLPPSLFQSEMPVTVSLSDSGGTAALIPGQPLVVRLPTNPSTGYSWSYTVKGDDVLRLDSVSGVSASANGMVGSPGEQVWSFRAQGTGHSVLTYVYTRAWEKTMPPALTVMLNVAVKPAP